MVRYYMSTKTGELFKEQGSKKGFTITLLDNRQNNYPEVKFIKQEPDGLIIVFDDLFATRYNLVKEFVNLETGEKFVVVQD